MLKKITRFFAPPSFEDDEEKQKSARLLTMIILASLTGLVFMLISLPLVRLPYATLAIAVLLVVWFVMKAGYVHTASVIVVAGIGIVLVLSTLTGGGVRAVGFAGFTILIIFSGVLLGWKAVMVVSAFSVIYGAVLFGIESQGWIDSYDPELKIYWLGDSIFFVLIGFMLTVALRMMNEAIRRANRESGERSRVRDEYQALYDNSPMGMYRSSVDGRMIEANEALTRFNGYDSKAEFLRSVTDISAEWYVERDRRGEFQKELIDRGQVSNFESEVYRHKTRERVWISENARVVLDEKGRVQYYEGTVEDITPRKQAEIELRRREAMLETVTFSAEQFLMSPDWRDSIGAVLQRLGMTINATHAYLFEDHPGPEGEPLTSMRHEWTAPGYPDDLERGLYQNSPIHQDGFEEQVEELKKGSARIGTTATFNPIERQLMDEAGVRSILEVPIFVNGREWGAIGFDDFEQERAWTAAEVDSLKIAANVLGAAIKRQLDETTLQVELLQRKALIEELSVRNSESETLRDSLESIVSSLEFSQIIENILDQIKRVVPYDSASIWRFENQMQFYITGRNVPPEVTRSGYGFEINPGNSAYPIIRGGVPYVLNLDVQSELQDFQMEPHTYVRSWLAIPLKRRGEIVGLIALDGRRKNQFTQHHAELAVIFANQVVIALENSRLFSELQSELAEREQVELDLRQRESILAVVAEAGNLLLKSPDWELEIDAILEKLGQTINATHAYICENHRDAKGLLVSSMRFEWTARSFPSDLEDPKYRKVPLIEPDFISWYEILKSGKPYIGDELHLSPEDMDFIADRGMKALLDVPIFVDGVWWGTTGFDDMSVYRAWTTAEIDALLVAGNLLGAAIQRQRADAALKEELKQRRQVELDLRQRETMLEALAESANRFLRTSDWRMEVKHVLERLGRAMNSSHAYLFEKHVSEDGRLLNSLRYEWLAPGQISDMDKPAYQNALTHNDGFERYYALLDSGEPFVGSTSALSLRERDHLNALGIKALLEMRIVVDDIQWGTLGFDETTAAREWTPQEVDVLRVSTSVLGAAIKRQRDEAALKNELNQRRSLIGELENKNTELERFTYTVSHDLKSPLFTIRGFLGYLQEDALSGNMERLSGDIQRIADATERMQQLLNDLLELSRIGRLMNEPQRLHLGEIIDEVLEHLHGPIHARGVKVAVEEGLPVVFGDRQRLFEVLQNLVENAAKFMGDQPAPRIEIGFTEGGGEGSMPVFHVRDNGMGISPDHFDRIFGLFNKLDPHSPGTGIGLALVKRIIEFHGGQIWVESEAGKGAAFYFMLPDPGVTP